MSDLISNNAFLQTGICFEDYNTSTGEYCGEWAGATLRKMPVWGRSISDDEINFEWPTQDDWAAISPKAQLQSFDA